MKTRGCVDTETGNENPTLPPLPLSADLYAVHSSQPNQISIRKLRGWLPEWESLKPVGQVLASGEEYPVGSYAYVQLVGGRGRAPVMVLEKRQLRNGRRLCLSAWLYTRTDANLTASWREATWPRREIYMMSTHLQVVDCETLDGVLENALYPNTANILDLRSGMPILRPRSSPQVRELFDIIDRIRRDRGPRRKCAKQAQSSPISQGSIPHVLEAPRRGTKNRGPSTFRSEICDVPQGPGREGIALPILNDVCPLPDHVRSLSTAGVEAAARLDDGGHLVDKLKAALPQEAHRAVDADVDRLGNTLLSDTPTTNYHDSAPHVIPKTRRRARLRRSGNCSTTAGSSINYVYQIRCDLERLFHQDSITRGQLGKAKRSLKKLKALGNIDALTIQRTRIARTLRDLVTWNVCAAADWSRFCKQCKQLLEIWQPKMVPKKWPITAVPRDAERAFHGTSLDLGSALVRSCREAQSLQRPAALPSS